MRHEEFITLLTAYTNKTSRLRTSLQHWSIGTETELDDIASNLGRLVSLIQDGTTRNLFCVKENEYLLIYNGERIIDLGSDASHFWSLNMIVKPISQLEDTTALIGNAFQVIINDNTGEVMNSAKCLLDTGLVTQQEIDWQSPDVPVSYGNYNQYLAPCCFLAVSSYRPLDHLEDFFTGKYDKNTALQESKAFDSFLAASDFFMQKKDLGQYIIELPHPKEKLEHFKEAGLGNEIVLIIDLTSRSIIARHPILKNNLPSIQEELDRFKAALNIPKLSLVTTEEPAGKEAQKSVEQSVFS